MSLHFFATFFLLHFPLSFFFWHFAARDFPLFLGLSWQPWPHSIMNCPCWAQVLIWPEGLNGVHEFWSSWLTQILGLFAASLRNTRQICLQLTGGDGGGATGGGGLGDGDVPGGGGGLAGGAGAVAARLARRVACGVQGGLGLRLHGAVESGLQS